MPTAGTYCLSGNDIPQRTAHGQRGKGGELRLDPLLWLPQEQAQLLGFDSQHRRRVSGSTATVNKSSSDLKAKQKTPNQQKKPPRQSPARQQRSSWQQPAQGHLMGTELGSRSEAILGLNPEGLDSHTHSTSLS